MSTKSNEDNNRDLTGRGTSNAGYFSFLKPSTSLKRDVYPTRQNTPIPRLTSPPDDRQVESKSLPDSDLEIVDFTTDQVRSDLRFLRALHSVKSAFPKSPLITTTIMARHKLRWLISDGASAVLVNAANIGISFSLTTALIATLVTSFKIHEVTVYGSIDPDSTTTSGIANVQVDWLAARTPAKTTVGMATPGVPMRTVSRPPKQSFGGMWTNQDYGNTTTIFQVSFPAAFNGILEIDMSMSLVDAPHVGGTTTPSYTFIQGRAYMTNFAQNAISPLGYYGAPI